MTNTTRPIDGGGKKAIVTSYRFFYFNSQLNIIFIVRADKVLIILVFFGVLAMVDNTGFTRRRQNA